MSFQLFCLVRLVYLIGGDAIYDVLLVYCVSILSVIIIWGFSVCMSSNAKRSSLVLGLGIMSI